MINNHNNYNNNYDDNIIKQLKIDTIYELSFLKYTINIFNNLE